MSAPVTAAGPGTTCPSCGEPTAVGDAFCESCGAELSATPEATATGPGDPLEESARTHLITPPGADDTAPSRADDTSGADSDPPTGRVERPCVACGGGVGTDGYCTVCGIRAGNGREHVVATPNATVAGVCDKGIVHPRNEDAMALAVASDWAALVVCDGVSSSTDSDVASQAAADVARDVLAAAPPAPGAAPAARVTHWSDQLRAAGRAAGIAASQAVPGDTDNPPSCTFVAAVVDGDLIVAAWIGDSRAYWLPDEGTAEQLTVDDSWATEQIALGVAREVAEAGPRAHAITRWLGRDSPPGDASTSTSTVRSPGWLMVCSDGLWNYCSEAGDLTELIAAQKTAEPLALAEGLVAWANAQGGHDNITVTLARLDPCAVAVPASTATPAAEGVS